MVLEFFRRGSESQLEQVESKIGQMLGDARHSFDLAANDLVQYRLRGARAIQDLWGWTFSTFVEATIEDNESTISLGIYMTRSF